MMSTRNSHFMLFPIRLQSLSVMLFACFFVGCRAPLQPEEVPPTPEEEMIEEHADRDFVVFDAGVVDFDSKIFYEDASASPAIYLFDSSNHLSTDLLQERNPYVRFGYKGFLYSDRDPDRLLLCSSMVRVNTQNSELLPGFKPEGRMSVLSGKTFEVIKQKDFRAFSAEAQSFPSEVFAFDEHSVYLYFFMSKKTFRVDLDTAPQKQVPIPSLEGKSISNACVIDGRMYALESLDSGAQLIEFDPSHESCRTYPLPDEAKVVGRDGALLSLVLRNGQIGIYSLRKHAFVIGPMRIDESLGQVYGVALDQKAKRLYLAFNQAHLRPHIFEVSLSELSEKQLKGDDHITPRKFAKLNLLTSDPLSGKTRLFVDQLQHKLFVFYHHSEKLNLGGQVNIYDLNALQSTELQKPVLHYALGGKLNHVTLALGHPQK